MLLHYGVKLVGIMMSIFAPNYATFAIGRLLIACFIGYSIAGYVLSKNPLHMCDRLMANDCVVFDFDVVLSFACC